MNELIDKMVYKLAEELYNKDRNELMPNWDGAPSNYARAYLNQAYEIIKKRLGI